MSAELWNKEDDIQAHRSGWVLTPLAIERLDDPSSLPYVNIGPEPIFDSDEQALQFVKAVSKPPFACPVAKKALQLLYRGKWSNPPLASES